MKCPPRNAKISQKPAPYRRLLDDDGWRSRKTQKNDVRSGYKVRHVFSRLSGVLGAAVDSIFRVNKVNSDIKHFRLTVDAPRPIKFDGWSNCSSAQFKESAGLGSSGLIPKPTRRIKFWLHKECPTDLKLMPITPKLKCLLPT